MKQADQAILIKIIGYCADIGAIIEQFGKNRELDELLKHHPA